MRTSVSFLLCLLLSAALFGAADAVRADGPMPYAPMVGPMGRPIGPMGRPMGPMMGPRRPMMGGLPMLRPRRMMGGPLGGMPGVVGVMPGPGPGARRFEAPAGRVCFSPAETREKIVTHGLTEPFRALRPGRLQGEALRARLCRWKPDQFVYEIAVLRRDGRIVHIYMNAQNGQTVGAFGDPDRP